MIILLSFAKEFLPSKSWLFGWRGSSVNLFQTAYHEGGKKLLGIVRYLILLVPVGGFLITAIFKVFLAKSESPLCIHPGVDAGWITNVRASPTLARERRDVSLCVRETERQ